MKKRFLALLLTFCLVLSLCSVTAFADESDTTNNLPVAVDGVITLTSDVSISSLANLFTSGVSTDDSSKITIDLAGYTLTLNASSSLTLTGSQSLSFVDNTATGSATGNNLNAGTLKLTGLTSTASFFIPEAGASVSASNINVESTGSVFFPKGDAASVTVENCNVKTTGVYCVATNAGSADHYGVIITLKDSVLTADESNNDDCAVMINVDGTLDIDNCVITGNRQAVVVRAGTATIDDSTLIVTGAWIDATTGDEDNRVSSAWSGGNEVASSALTVGNYVNGVANSYTKDATVTLTDTTVTSQALAPAIYVDANQSYSGTLTVSGDNTVVTGNVTTGRYSSSENSATQATIAITGGTFSTDVGDYLDDTLIAVEQEDGTYVIETLSKENAVACITKNGKSTYYKTLAEAIKAAEDGNTITLLKDASGCGIVIDSSNYSTNGLTIDFNGFTYTVDQTPLAGSSGKETQCFQLLEGGSVTMKNGEIVANNSGIAMIIQNYCNLTLDGMTLDATQGTNNVSYVLSNNCGNVTIEDTTITAKEGNVAFDVYGGFQNYSNVTVTVTGNSKINGKVEVARKSNSTNNNNNKLVIESGSFDGKLSVTSNTNTAVEISGGHFSERVSDYVIEKINAELISSDPDNTTPYSYYESVEDAKEAAQPGDLIVDLSERAGDSQILGVGFDATAEGANAAMNAIIANLCGSKTVTDSDVNTMWAFLKLSDTATAYTLTVTDASGSTVYESTDADGLTEATGLHYVYFTFNTENGGSPAEQGIASGVYTVTLTTAMEDENNEEIAQATIALSKVSFNLNNGTLVDETGYDATPADTYYAAGSTIELPTPTRSGRYQFKGWDDGTDTYTDTYTVPAEGKDITLTDSWTYTGGSGGGGTTTYSITVASVSNGSVTASPTNASKGTTVTLTVSPNEGYELSALTVTDANGNVLTLTDKGDGKYTFTMPASKVTVSATFTEIESEHDCPSKIFTDVDITQYYHEAVDWAVLNGVTNGTSETTLSPNASCTRAQMVTFLWRAAGSPAPTTSVNPFTDLESGAYYYDAVLWAVEKGITNGTSATTFSPNETVTRGHTVTFLYRYAGSPTVSGGNNFTDVPTDAYYADAVQWAVANEVTYGTSTTTFSPENDCTRAQIVTFLYRDLAE